MNVWGVIFSMCQVSSRNFCHLNWRFRQWMTLMWLDLAAFCPVGGAFFVHICFGVLNVCIFRCCLWFDVASCARSRQLELEDKQSMLELELRKYMDLSGAYLHYLRASASHHWRTKVSNWRPADLIFKIAGICKLRSPRQDIGVKAWPQNTKLWQYSNLWPRNAYNIWVISKWSTPWLETAIPWTLSCAPNFLILKSF